jgi:hypothetical protein
MIADPSPPSPETVTRNVLNAIFQELRMVVLVDSPPGAGKTYLVETIAGLAVASYGWRTALATPKKNQTYDFLARLIERFPHVPVQLLHAEDDLVPTQLNGRIVMVEDANDLRPGPSLIVATVDKLQFATHKFAHNEFGLLIVDEAYQCTYRQVFPCFSIAPRAAMVGDPGQLSPFSEIDERRFEAARDHVHWSLPRELLNRFPDIATFQLPVTRRLPEDTVSFVQPSFYPDFRFGSLVNADERRLIFSAAQLHDRLDRALDSIALGATIVGIALPRLHYQTDIDGFCRIKGRPSESGRHSLVSGEQSGRCYSASR